MLEPGDQIDIWVVERALGSGGMGSVYRCHNRTASRILAAVKVLEGGVRLHPEAEARFVREAEILFQLDHPNIVKVRNIRTEANPPYLEMEFVEGESLETLLQRGALPYDECVSLMEQTAAAVAYLHRKGIRHRDIKPANLLVKPDGRVKLVDFGLAMEANISRLTQEGITFGTVSYAPPEWIAPDTLDPSLWDIYSLGVVFYEMLTGRVAFPVSGQGSIRQQAMQVMVGKQGHRPLDPGDHFHDDVRDLIRGMTQADPAVRLSDAEIVHRLVKSLRGELKREAGATLTPPRDDDEEYPSVVQDLPSPDIMRTPEGLPSRFEEMSGGGAATWVSSEIATDVGPPGRTHAPPSLLDASTAPAPAPRQLPHSTLPQANRRLSTPTISLPPARFAAPVLVVAGSLVVALLVLVGGLAAFLLQASQVPGTRPVDVVVTGVPHALQVGVKVGEILPRGTDGAVYTFDAIPHGEHEITWVMGANCPVASCPGLDCPAWCGTGTVHTTIAEGGAPQIVTLALQIPPQRMVRLPLPALDPELPVSVGLAGREGAVSVGEAGAAAVVSGVTPGVHALSVTLGDCEAEALGCWPDGTCPPGCVSYAGELVVGWGTSELVHDLSLPAPEKPKSRVRRPSAAGAPVVAASGGGAVSNREFAAWLRANPDWLPRAAVAAGLADENYLTGWDGTKPPPGREHHAVTHVSWHAAAAYCRSRGGLAPLGAPPDRWTESDTQPWIEFRMQDGKAAWKASDGRTSQSLNLRTSNSTMGFRCAR